MAPYHGAQLDISQDDGVQGWLGPLILALLIPGAHPHEDPLSGPGYIAIEWT